MTRRPLIAGNWKMNKTASEATRLLQQLSYGYDDRLDAVDVVVCPPFTALRSAQVTLNFDQKTNLRIGAQDVYWQESGAFTGAVSAAMLKDLSCTHCIIGHSERREYFGETNEDIARKAVALTEAGIAPVLCCGESLAVREAGGALAHVVAQIGAALEPLTPAQAAQVVIAYEPIWAIGTGRTPTPKQANEVCAALRDAFCELYGPAAAHALRILYGGSLNTGNIDAFAAEEHIDGGLVGGASLVAEDFLALAQAFARPAAGSGAPFARSAGHATPAAKPAAKGRA